MAEKEQEKNQFVKQVAEQNMNSALLLMCILKS